MPMSLLESTKRVSVIALFLAGASLLLAGCTAGGQGKGENATGERVAEMEQTLTKAGFQPLYADTAKKFERLKSLPQHQVVLHEVAGKYRYVYADDVVCGCLYTGDKAAYERLQAAVAERRQLEAQARAAAFTTDVPEQWQGWGPWYDPAY